MGLKLVNCKSPLLIIKIIFSLSSIQGTKKQGTCLQIFSLIHFLFFLSVVFFCLFLLSHLSIARYYYCLVISFIAHSLSLFHLIKYTQNDDRSNCMRAPDWHPYWAKSETKYMKGKMTTSLNRTHNYISSAVMATCVIYKNGKLVRAYEKRLIEDIRTYIHIYIYIYIHTTGVI